MYDIREMSISEIIAALCDRFGFDEARREIDELEEKVNDQNADQTHDCMAGTAWASRPEYQDNPTGKPP